MISADMLEELNQHSLPQHDEGGRRTKWGFYALLGLNGIETGCFASNAASRRSIEKTPGFVFEGVLRESGGDRGRSLSAVAPNRGAAGETGRLT